MKISQIALLAVFGLLVLNGVITSRLLLDKPAFGVVRVDEVVAGHMKEYVTESTTEADLKEGSERFSAAIHEVISDYGQDGVILFVDPAVVTDLPDYTEAVARETSERMRTNR